MIVIKKDIDLGKSYIYIYINYFKSYWDYIFGKYNLNKKLQRNVI